MSKEKEKELSLKYSKNCCSQRKKKPAILSVKFAIRAFSFVCIFNPELQSAIRAQITDILGDIPPGLSQAVYNLFQGLSGLPLIAVSKKKKKKKTKNKHKLTFNPFPGSFKPTIYFTASISLEIYCQ